MTPHVWSRSRIGLAAGLLATLAAAYFAPAEESLEVGVSARVKEGGKPSPPQSLQTSASGSPQVLVMRDRSGDAADETDGPFAARWWVAAPMPPTPAKAPPAEVGPPVPPPAPPLPFKVLGRYEEDGQDVIFLQHNEFNLVVRSGDVIATTYKVESIKGAQMTLRYLPTNQAQTLDIGLTQ